MAIGRRRRRRERQRAITHFLMLSKLRWANTPRRNEKKTSRAETRRVSQLNKTPPPNSKKITYTHLPPSAPFLHDLVSSVRRYAKLHTEFNGSKFNNKFYDDQLLLFASSRDELRRESIIINSNFPRMSSTGFTPAPARICSLRAFVCLFFYFFFIFQEKDQTTTTTDRQTE